MAQETGHRTSQTEVEKEKKREEVQVISCGDDEEVGRSGNPELLIKQLVLVHGQSNPR
jgi:mRNA deadenylase 3'-5' endonuclease subunit Ccr4